MKKFVIKHYNNDLVFQRTLNPNILKNDISFSSQINWWQWQLKLNLDLPITNVFFTQWDIIKVYKFDDRTPNWELLYTWIIEDITKTATDYDEISLNITWISSLFKRLLYNESWYVVNKNDDPWNIVEDIVDYFNTKHITLTKTWIVNLWDSVNYDFKYTDLLKAMWDLKDMSNNYYWFLGADLDMTFKVKSWTADHLFTYKKDLFSVDIDERWMDIFNTFILNRKSWTTTYTDTNSISTYWLREKYLSNTQIADLTSADNFWNNYIAQNKDTKKNITLKVNSKYFYNNQTIENIYPWQICKIRNMELSLSDTLLINKVNYNPDYVTINLEKFDNFIELIQN